MVKGDSATAELQATQVLLTQTETKCSLLDSTNKTYQGKVENYIKQIATYQERDQTRVGIIEDLTADNKQLRFQLKVGTITVGALLVAALLIK